MAIDYDARINKLLENKEKIYNENLPKNFKSALITCSNCGSKIAKQYIRAYNCPVCDRRDIFMNATLEKRLNTIDEKVKKLRQDKVENKKKTSKITFTALDVNDPVMHNIKAYEKICLVKANGKTIKIDDEKNYGYPYIEISEANENEDDSWGFWVHYYYRNKTGVYGFDLITYKEFDISEAIRKFKKWYSECDKKEIIEAAYRYLADKG